MRGAKRQTTGTGKLDMMDSVRWQEQATAEAAAWLDAGNKCTGRDKVAYAAGHAAGWRDAIATLALQGVIVRFDNEPKR